MQTTAVNTSQSLACLARRFTLPFFCLVGNICAFGMDRWLFLTHLIRVASSTVHSCYGIDGRAVVAGLSSRSAARIQWYTGVKACLNTLMVFAGARDGPLPTLLPHVFHQEACPLPLRTCEGCSFIQICKGVACEAAMQSSEPDCTVQASSARRHSR
jgi:hypothetical protein